MNKAQVQTAVDKWFNQRKLTTTVLDHIGGNVWKADGPSGEFGVVIGRTDCGYHVVGTQEI